MNRHEDSENHDETADRDEAGQDAAGQDAAGQDAAGQDAAGQDAAGQDAADNEPQRATLDDWKLLDVMPGVPERVLRAAYARKLKVTKPETDPEGFQKLRAAYERALASLAQDRPAPDPAETPDAPAEAPVEDYAAALAELMHRFESRRRRADSDGALAAVDEALAGTFRAAWRNAVEDALFDSVVGDTSTRLKLVRALSTRFDWHEATGRQATRSGDKMNLVRERVEAADLVDAYRARAAAARAGTGPAADRILVTILGPYRVGLFDRALGDEERDVAATFMNDAYQRLAQVDGFVDPRMLAAVRAALGATPLANPPPVVQAGTESATTATTASAPAPRRRRFEWRYVYFALLAMMLLGRAFQSDINGTRTAPDAPSHGSSTGRPGIPNSLDVTWKEDGTGLLNLRPVVNADTAGTIRAVRVRFSGKGFVRDIPMSDLRENGIVEVPIDADEMWLRLVFDDGTFGPDQNFDLERPKKDKASEDTLGREPEMPHLR